MSFNMTTDFFRALPKASIFNFLLVLSVVTSSVIAQTSSADVVNKIQARYDQDKAGLVEALRNLPDSPASMDDGSFSSTLSTLSTELDDLAKQLQGANQIIEDKRSSLTSNHALSEADKSELLAELNRQQQPLTDLANSISSFKSKVSDLLNTQIPAWKEQYHTFSDVEGAAAAKEKLSNSIKSFNSDDSAAPKAPRHKRKSQNSN